MAGLSWAPETLPVLPVPVDPAALLVLPVLPVPVVPAALPVLPAPVAP